MFWYLIPYIATGKFSHCNISQRSFDIGYSHKKTFSPAIVYFEYESYQVDEYYGGVIVCALTYIERGKGRTTQSPHNRNMYK